MNMDRKKAILYLAAAAVLWSTGGLFIKLIDWNPMAIAGARSGIAAIIMLIYLRRPVKVFEKTKLIGAFTYAAVVILFVVANKLTTSANAILLQYTAPIWVIVFSKFFLKEKSEKRDIVSIIIVMAGMILFFVGDLKSGNLIGNIIAVLSGVAMAGMVIFLKLQKDGSQVEMTLIGNVVTFLIGLPFFFISPLSLKSAAGLMALGIFQLGFSYILYGTAIKYVSSVEAIIIPVLEPLLNPVWVFLFTGEAPGIFALIGGVIVVVTIIGREIHRQSNSVKEDEAELKIS